MKILKILLFILLPIFIYSQDLKPVGGGGSTTVDTSTSGKFWSKHQTDSVISARNISLSSAVGVLGANKTVTFTSSYTATNIQDSINAQPRNLGGFTLTFQFADGTYTLSSALSFNYFYAGTLRIQGNSSESQSLHTTQAVILNFTNNTSGINLTNVSALYYVDFLKITVQTSAASNYAIYPFMCLSGWVRWCNLAGNSTANFGACIRIGSGFAVIYQTYVANTQYGIEASYASNVISNGNNSTGTNPKYGIAADYGSTMAEYDATQPTGATANTFNASGGLVRTP